MISLIAAVARNGVIGKDGDLPWHLGSDFKYFVETTKNHPVIMGFNTYLSIPDKFRPLKNRLNIVLAKDVDYDFPDEVKVANSIDEALSFVDQSEEAFVIGGASVYKQFLEQDLVDKLYITRVEAEVNGDLHFPEIDQEWKIVKEEAHKASKVDDYNYTFLIYEKEQQKVERS